jgi:hypothetical protein
LVDFPVFGKFWSGRIKCDVTPESRIIVVAFFSKGLFVLIHWFIQAFIVARRLRRTSALLMLLMVIGW